MALLSCMPCLSGRKFRTYFLLALILFFISQSAVVYYILHSVAEAEGAEPAGPETETSARPPHEKSHPTAPAPRSPEMEAGYTGRFECAVAGKTALSAIKRAKTQHCKKELSRVACQLQDDQLFPPKIPNFCQRVNSSPGSLLGCYKDGDEQKILSEYGALHFSSRRLCALLCFFRNFLEPKLIYNLSPLVCRCQNA